MHPRYLCACVSLIICLFIGSGIYSLSFLTFPLDARLDSRRELRSPVADLSSWTYQNIKPAFSERLSCLSEDKPAFLRVDLISHLFGRQLAISTVLLVASWQFLLEFSPCKSCYFSILAPILLKLHILAQNFSKFSCKNLKSCNFLSFGQSCWNCIFKLLRLRAFQRRMACPVAAKISGSSHLRWWSQATAFVPELLKAITFLSYVVSRWNFIFELD